MTPTTFREQTAVLAKDQPEYLPLPVASKWRLCIVSCWKLTFWERVKLLFTGRLWLCILTFGGLVCNRSGPRSISRSSG